MKHILVLVVALSAGALSAVIIPKTQGEITPFFRYLGVVNGKAYFNDPTLRNWEDAGAYCAHQDLQLAEIKDYEEYQGIRKLYNATYFDGEFWTAGRDSHLMPQIVYNNTKTGLSEDLKNTFYVIPEFPFQTCLYFKHMISHGILSLAKCSAEKMVLCETAA